MPDEAEYQPQNSIFQTRLLPDTVSSVALSGGRTIAHTYYLGPNNTIPFVKLENPAAAMEISWGELITIRPGQQVNIRNTSKMPGDLQIQSGVVPAPVPPRVTVPIKLIVSGEGSGAYITCEFPCDTRKARRAWLGVELQGNVTTSLYPAVETTFVATIKSYHEMHSRVPALSGAAYSFSSTVSALSASEMGMIPLGPSHNVNAMKLADYSSVEIYIGVSQGGLNIDNLTNGTAAYVVEY